MTQGEGREGRYVGVVGREERLSWVGMVMDCI